MKTGQKMRLRRPLIRHYFKKCFRKPINVVVGKPIPVPQIDDPSAEQIEEVHAKYVAALVQLYEDYNPTYGDPKIKLKIG